MEAKRGSKASQTILAANVRYYVCVKQRNERHGLIFMGVYIVQVVLSLASPSVITHLRVDVVINMKETVNHNVIADIQMHAQSQRLLPV